MTFAVSYRDRDDRRPAPLVRHGMGIVVASLAAVLALSVPASASAATFTPNVAASELVRLLNGERTTHGLPALAVDSFLTIKARDGAVVCPDGSGTMEGRAKDMATHNYLAHALRLCPTYDVGDAMTSWGYTSYLGEIIGYQRRLRLQPVSLPVRLRRAPGQLHRGHDHRPHHRGHRQLRVHDQPGPS